MCTSEGCGWFLLLLAPHCLPEHERGMEGDLVKSTLSRAVMVAGLYLSYPMLVSTAASALSCTPCSVLSAFGCGAALPTPMPLVSLTKLPLQSQPLALQDLCLYGLLLWPYIGIAMGLFYVFATAKLLVLSVVSLFVGSSEKKRD